MAVSTSGAPIAPADEAEVEVIEEQAPSAVVARASRVSLSFMGVS